MPKGYGDGSRATRFEKGIIPWDKGKGEPSEGDKECPVCHIIFHYKRAAYNDPPKTCSKDCRYKLASITGTHHITRTCLGCGKPFDRPPSLMFDEHRAFVGSYCSVKCRFSKKDGFTKREKETAHNRVRIAVRQGKLIPRPCLVCGEIDSQAHHHKGYNPENWYEVVWLCRKHHLLEEERLRTIR